VGVLGVGLATGCDALKETLVGAPGIPGAEECQGPEVTAAIEDAIQIMFDRGLTKGSLDALLSDGKNESPDYAFLLHRKSSATCEVALVVDTDRGATDMSSLQVYEQRWIHHPAAVRRTSGSVHRDTFGKDVFGEEIPYYISKIVPAPL